MGRPIPSYWWDFDSKQDVIVQSDWPGGECLARFYVEEKADTEAQIAEAEQLIGDFKAGRKTPPWGIKH